MAGFYMGIKLFRFEIQLPDCPESFDYADNMVLLLILDLRLRPVIKSVMADKARSVAVNAIDVAVNQELGNQNLQLIKFLLN